MYQAFDHVLKNLNSFGENCTVTVLSYKLLEVKRDCMAACKCAHI